MRVEAKVRDAPEDINSRRAPLDPARADVLLEVRKRYDQT